MNASEINASEMSTSKINTSQTDISEINTSQTDISEISTSEISTSEINTSEINTSEINTSQTDISDSDISDSVISESITSQTDISDIITPELKTFGINSFSSNASAGSADKTRTTEQVYYNYHGVWVSNNTFSVRGESYSIEKINGVGIRTERPDRRGPSRLIVSGVLLAILGIGIVLLIIGIWWWFSQQSVYWLVLETDESQKQPLRSSDLKSIQQVQAALTCAMTQGLNRDEPK